MKITGPCLIRRQHPVWCRLEEAVSAYQDGSHAASLAEFQARADRGDVARQSSRVVMYEHRQGVLQDYAPVAMWYWRSAGQGTRLAQYNPGVMYEQGHGVLHVVPTTTG